VKLSDKFTRFCGERSCTNEPKPVVGLILDVVDGVRDEFERRTAAELLLVANRQRLAKIGDLHTCKDVWGLDSVNRLDSVDRLDEVGSSGSRRDVSGTIDHYEEIR
jgi:hypothetical protein